MSNTYKYTTYLTFARQTYKPNERCEMLIGAVACRLHYVESTFCLIFDLSHKNVRRNMHHRNSLIINVYGNSASATCQKKLENRKTEV